jgi:outer membrane protein assembly factor BamB
MRRSPTTLVILFLLSLLSGLAVAQRPRTTQTDRQPSRIDSQVTPAAGSMEIYASWPAQSGVSRFRFQLARDSEFNDIILDRVVYATETQADTLMPGTYYWRVAPLTTELGQFSAPRAVEAFRKTQVVTVEPRPIEAPIAPIVTGPVVRQPVTPLPLFVSEDGWRAAIGNVSRPTLIHLRSPNSADLMAMNSEGVVFALDAASGVTLWATRANAPSPRSHSNVAFVPIAVPTGNGLENVLVPFDGGVRVLQGATGRELWRTQLPGATGAAAVGLPNGASEVFLTDDSHRRLIVLDGRNGNVIARSKLPSSTFGPPVTFNYLGAQGALIAFDDGRLEVRDRNGEVVRSGNANGRITTSPLFVGAANGLVLVGTDNGLTAFDARDLRGLGRVTIGDAVPRGLLASADLDRNGSPEVVMITSRAQVVAIDAADGKIRWQQDGAAWAEAAAFADLNGDGTLDVIVAAGPAFAMALSGRDGSVIWKAESFSTTAAVPGPRLLITNSTAGGAMIIGSDPAGGSLRALQLHRTAMSR